MVAQVRYKYEDVLNFYFDDLFDIILAFQKPLIASYEFLRRKHAEYKFRRLVELKHLPRDKKEKIVLKFLECLPDRSSNVAYSESYKKILEVFSSHFSDTIKLLEELNKTLSAREQEKIIKIQMQKNSGIIDSVRRSLSEIILDSDEPEKVMIIDQALFLADRLIEESILESDEQKRLGYFLHLLILILRIDAIKRGLSDYEMLYDDIAIISGDLRRSKVSEIPAGVAELLTSSG